MFKFPSSGRAARRTRSAVQLNSLARSRSVSAGLAVPQAVSFFQRLALVELVPAGRALDDRDRADQTAR